MNNVSVRDFKPEDEQAILELYKLAPELQRNTPVDFLDDEERQWAINNSRKLFLVAENGEHKVVGFAYIKIKDRTADEEKARLLHIAVAPVKRRGGIASALLKECERRLVDMGITKLYSCVNVKNQSMVDFFRNKRFEQKEVFYRFEKGLRPSDFNSPAWPEFEWGDEDGF